jgi:hypothetical protein
MQATDWTHGQSATRDATLQVPMEIMSSHEHGVQ